MEKQLCDIIRVSAEMGKVVTTMSIPYSVWFPLLKELDIKELGVYSFDFHGVQISMGTNALLVEFQK